MPDSDPPAVAPPATNTGIGKVKSALRREFSGLQPRVLLLSAVMRLLPPMAFVGTRTRLMRRAGFSIGPEAGFFGRPILRGGYDLHRNLEIGSGCHVNEGAHFDLSGPVVLEDRVGVGHEVLFVTNSHQIGDDHQRGGQTVVLPIRIRTGAWIGARSTILPGVTIGEGAVVAAGSLVKEDVPAHSLVAGVPATVRRDLRTPSP